MTRGSTERPSIDDTGIHGKMKVLALDAGTSSVKAVLATSALVAEAGGWTGGWTVDAATTVPLAPPRGVDHLAGASEQEASAWWDAAVEAIREVLLLAEAGSVSAVALSGQMQSLVLLDGDGDPLHRALLFSDTRATAEAAQLEEELGRDRLLAANWKGAASVLPKLRWLLAHERAAVERASEVCLSAPDFLFRKLTGSARTEPTSASTTGLVHAASEMRWAHELLTDAALPAGLVAKLPPICRGAGLLAELTAEASAALGGLLAVGTAVCLGAGDLGATTLGALGGTVASVTGAAGRAEQSETGSGTAVGTAETGTYCYLGTSGWVATVRPSFMDCTCGAFSLTHPLPSRRILAAPMTTAGGNVQWLCGPSARATLSSGTTGPHLPDLPSSPEGLLFAGMEEGEALAAFESEACLAPEGSARRIHVSAKSAERSVDPDDGGDSPHTQVAVGCCTCLTYEARGVPSATQTRARASSG